MDEMGAAEVAGEKLGTAALRGIEANACVGLIWVVERVVGGTESTGCESRERGKVHLVPPLGEGVAEWSSTVGERSRFRPPLPLMSINLEGEGEAADDSD